MSWGNRGRVFLLDQLLAAVTVIEALVCVAVASLAVVSAHAIFVIAGQRALDAPTVAFLGAPFVGLFVAGWLAVTWARRGLTVAQRWAWGVCLVLTGVGLIPWTVVWLLAILLGYGIGHPGYAHPC